jgi:hypothetical protein
MKQNQNVPLTPPEHDRGIRAPLQRTRRVILSLLLVLSCPAWAETIIVDETTCTLVDAITAANTNTVAGGCPAGSGADTIELKTNVTLTEVDNSDWNYGPSGLPKVETHITIEGGGFTIERDALAPSFRLMLVQPSGTLSLNDVTLVCQASGSAVSSFTEQSVSIPPNPDNYGGAIRNSGSLTLTNSAVLHCGAPKGGGIFVSGSATLTNSTLSHNSALSGGGVAIDGGELTMTDCTVSSNTAWSGGGLALDGAELTMAHSTVSSNESVEGAGIWALGGTVSVTSSTLADNRALLPCQYGPDCYGTASGGGIYSRSSSLILTNSTLSGNWGNSEDHDGETGQLFPTGCGGAIFGSGGSVSLVSSTLVDNWGNGWCADGIAVSAASASAGNTILANPPENCSIEIIDLGNNVAGDATCGIGFGDITAGVDFDTTLGDNGGPTRTHALLPGSVAIDAAGDCGLETDQRGLVRPRDGDGDGEAMCDVGAYEFQPPVTCEPDPASQGHWHRQCLGVPGSEGGIDPGRNGRGPSSPTEALFVEELMPCADDRLEDLGFYGTFTCEGIDADPANDPCEKAEKQLTALILNVCSNRLQETCDVDLSAQSCLSTDVGSLLVEVAGYIQAGSCQQAMDCAAAVNEGLGLVNGGESGFVEPQSVVPRKQQVERKRPGKLGR